MDVTVYTRGTTGATFSISDDLKNVILSDVDVTHVGSIEHHAPPTCKKITSSRIKGPLNLKIKGESKGSRFSPENFLVVCSIFSSDK
jgi:hypothetical protein